MSVSLAEKIQSPSKKRKHAEANESKSPRKKSKTDKTKSKRKGKEEDSQFRVVEASIVLSIPPRFAEEPMEGAKEMLDSLLMRYVPALEGVLLCHSNVTFLTSTAAIKNECPFLVCNVGFEATVWSPVIGAKLTGTVNICSPDHISLLVHKTFNVSVPRHHIPEGWEFEHGAAENDPEFQPENLQFDSSGEPITVAEQGGNWIHHLTGEKIGGDDGRVEFTVIGLTIANQMLSLIGSLQPDPFSPEHIPRSAIPAETVEQEHPDPTSLPELSDDAEDSDAEADPFESLIKMGKEAEERQAMSSVGKNTEEQRVEDGTEDGIKHRKKARKAVSADQEDERPAEKRKKKKKSA